jgi:hypothetical protein
MDDLLKVRGRKKLIPNRTPDKHNPRKKYLKIFPIINPHKERF